MTACQTQCAVALMLYMWCRLWHAEHWLPSIAIQVWRMGERGGGTTTSHHKLTISISKDTGSVLAVTTAGTHVCHRPKLLCKYSISYSDFLFPSMLIMFGLLHHLLLWHSTCQIRFQEIQQRPQASFHNNSTGDTPVVKWGVFLYRNRKCDLQESLPLSSPALLWRFWQHSQSWVHYPTPKPLADQTKQTVLSASPQSQPMWYNAWEILLTILCGH